MRPALSLPCLLLLSLLALPAWADLYKQVDSNGNITYTDVPPNSDAEPVELPPINLMEPAKTDSFPKHRNEEPVAISSYVSLVITSPGADETLRDNAGQITVSVSLTPDLQAGHQVILLVDNKPISAGQALSATASNVDRGSHQVGARVIDATGKTLITASPRTVHLKRQTVKPAPAKGSPSKTIN